MSNTSLVLNSFEKFDNIEVLQENIQELNQLIKNYMDNPKHLIFNLDLLEELSEDYLDHINFLSTLLKSNNYSLQVFSAPKAIEDKLNKHRFRNVPQIRDLSVYLGGLDKIERELRTESLLKAYIDETMKSIFTKSDTIIRRGELSIEDGADNFYHEVNYFQTFQLETGFFSFVITGSEKFFGFFLKKLQEPELAPIFNKIVESIPESLLEGVNIHDYLTHPYDKFPTEKIEVAGKEYPYFSNCVVMKIPLECEESEFTLEIWIPKVFAKEIYEFLNP